MPSYARLERSGLVQVLTAHGPDAPTLCEGWLTRDLAAHLVVRERRPVAMAGMAVRPLARRAERVRQQMLDEDWGHLLQLLAGGPPWWSPLRPVDRLANTLEFFVHHEDVRRAQPQWTPRELPSAENSALWRGVRFGLRGLLRSIPGGAHFRVWAQSADGREKFAGKPGKGATTITLTGPVGELVMFAFGRQAHTRVGLDGPPDAVAALSAARYQQAEQT